MSVTIISPKQLDASLLTIGKVSSFTRGPTECKKIEIKYDKKILYFSNGKMFSPFGVSQFPKPDECGPKTKIKYYINFNFKGEKEGFEGNETVGTVFNALTEFDLKLIELLLTHSGDIFSEATTEYNIIDNMYQRLIQMPKSDEYDPFLKVKLMTDYNNKKVLKCTSYSNENLKKPLVLDVDDMMKHVETRRWIRPVIKFDCIYYTNGKLYPSLEMYQMKIYEQTLEDKNKAEEAKKGKDGKSKKTNKSMTDFI